MSSESWHPPGSAPTSIQGPRAGGATQRLVGLLARLQSKSPRVHARITQLAGFPLASSAAQAGGKGKRKTSLYSEMQQWEHPTPLPLPPASSAASPGRAAWGPPGCDALPGNFYLAGSRCGSDLRGHLAGLAKIGHSSESAKGPPCLTSSLLPRGSVRHLTPPPTPSKEDPTSSCQNVWSGGARAGAVGALKPRALSLSRGCRESQGSGSHLPAKAGLRSSSSARGVSVLQPAPTPANSPAPRVSKAADPRRWRTRLLRLRVPGSACWCETLEPKVDKVDPDPKVFFPSCPTVRGLGPLPA